MNTQSFIDIYNKMKALTIANQNKVTDFNKGSVISTIYEAVARIAEEIYIETRIGYTNNLKALAYSVFDFKKKEGVKATAKVVFKSAEAIATDTTIPINTKIASGDLVFVTTEVATILANQTQSNQVTVQAEETGSKYNVKANSITSIESIISSNVVEVTNPLKADGGVDEESESDMLIRFKDYISGLQGTNEYGIKAKLLAIEGVRSVNIKEHFPPDNSYNFSIYIDNGTGGLPDSLKNEILKVINGDEEDYANYPGLRVPGMNIRVASAIPVSVDVAVTCTVYRIDHSTADFEIEDAVQQEINNLTIGNDILISSLILRLRQITYIKDVTEVKINNVAENLVLNPNQIAKFNSITIEYEDM